jgi:hypothetical protein
METTLYYEEVWLNRWATIALGFFITTLTPLSFPWFFDSAFSHLTLLYITLDTFFIFLFINFRRLSVRITRERIIVSFGLIRKKIMIDDVASVESEEATLWKYAGFGIRYSGDGSLAFIASPGKAMRIESKSGRPFVFSTRSQDKVIGTINELTSL